MYIVFRVPRSCSDVVGDFADVAYFILKPRCSQSGGSLTVNDINDALDNIAASHASNKSGMCTMRVVLRSYK